MQVKLKSTMAKNQTLTLLKGTVTPVPSMDTNMGEILLQVVPASKNVCWSPSGVIYVLHIRARKTNRSRVRD